VDGWLLMLIKEKRVQLSERDKTLVTNWIERTKNSLSLIKQE